MMIILKLQILHVLIKMIRQVLIEMILWKNMKFMKKKNYYNKYKEDNQKHHHGNETVINKSKELKALIKWLMSVNFKKKLSVIRIVTLYGGEIIELKKIESTRQK